MFKKARLLRAERRLTEITATIEAYLERTGYDQVPREWVILEAELIGETERLKFQPKSQNDFSRDNDIIDIVPCELD